MVGHGAARCGDVGLVVHPRAAACAVEEPRSVHDAQASTCGGEPGHLCVESERDATKGAAVAVLLDRAVEVAFEANQDAVATKDSSVVGHPVPTDRTATGDAAHIA